MTGATSLRAKSSTVARSVSCSPLNVRSMSFLFRDGFDDQECGVACDGGTGPGPQIADHTVDGRGEDVLHFHRFDDNEALARADPLSLDDLDDGDGAGHRREHRPAGALLPRRG